MDIPQGAKRVFQGIIFDVYHWQQRMFDGSFATYEVLSRPDTVQVIATEGEKILLGDEQQPDRPPFYSLFGGRMEKGETPEEGVKREFLEETGMISNSWELLKTYQPYHKIRWKVYIFVAREVRNVQSPQQEAGERIAVKRASFDEFIDIVFSDRFRGEEFAYDLMKMKFLHKTLDDFRQKIFSK